MPLGNIALCGKIVHIIVHVALVINGTCYIFVWYASNFKQWGEAGRKGFVRKAAKEQVGTKV